MKRGVSALGKALRETGQALDRMGMRAQDSWMFQEKICRHRAVMNLFDQRPFVSETAYVRHMRVKTPPFLSPSAGDVIGGVVDDGAAWPAPQVAPNASVIGNVNLKDQSSVW